MSHLSLRTKIFALCGVFLFVIALLGGISLYSSRQIIRDYATIAEVNFPNTKNMLLALSNMRQARIEVLQLSAEGRTDDENKKSVKKYEQAWSEFDQAIKDYLAVDFQPGEEALFSAWKKDFDATRDAEDRAIALFKKDPSDHSPERKQMQKIIFSEVPQLAAKAREALDTLTKYHTDAATQSAIQAKKSAEVGRNLILTVSISGLLFGFFTGFFMTRSLVKILQDVTAGIASTAQQVGSSAAEIASSSEQLSSATTEQASALQETAASLEQISTMISKSAESAASTESSSASSQSTAESGRAAVKQMLSSMNEINQSNEAIMNQVNAGNLEVAQIVNVIREISEKTKVINEIVFQTKLLSFNASVEAARAGEHGKGFAVVAEEVGNLAQMSGNAAKEITDMLDASMLKVEQIVKTTKSSVEVLISSGKLKVESGVKVAKECATALDEIVSNVSIVTNLAQEISSANREQSQGVNEINKAMTQLDTVTQQNSSTAVQSASSADALLVQSQALRDAVSELVRAVDGQSSGDRHAKVVTMNTTSHPNSQDRAA